MLGNALWYIAHFDIMLIGYNHQSVSLIVDLFYGLDLLHASANVLWFVREACVWNPQWGNLWKIAYMAEVLCLIPRTQRRDPELKTVFSTNSAYWLWAVFSTRRLILFIAAWSIIMTRHHLRSSSSCALLKIFALAFILVVLHRESVSKYLSLVGIG